MVVAMNDVHGCAGQAEHEVGPPQLKAGCDGKAITGSNQTMLRTV